MYERRADKSRSSAALICVVFSLLVVGFCSFTYFLLSPLLEAAGPRPGIIASVIRELRESSREALFSEHHDYKSLDHARDRLWSDDLLTPNGGYFTVDHETNNTDKLGISMFHQLHCLSMIRDEMQRLHEVIGDGVTAGSALRRHSHVGVDVGSPGHDDLEHTMHCFDYLRQVRSKSFVSEADQKSLLCMADVTIEHPKQFEDGKPYIDGMGPRKCKNWDLLYAASIESDKQPLGLGE